MIGYPIFGISSFVTILPCSSCGGMFLVSWSVFCCVFVSGEGFFFLGAFPCPVFIGIAVRWALMILVLILLYLLWCRERYMCVLVFFFLCLQVLSVVMLVREMLIILRGLVVWCVLCFRRYAHQSLCLSRLALCFRCCFLVRHGCSMAESGASLILVVGFARWRISWFSSFWCVRRGRFLLVFRGVGCLAMFFHVGVPRDGLRRGQVVCMDRYKWSMCMGWFGCQGAYAGA